MFVGLGQVAAVARLVVAFLEDFFVKRNSGLAKIEDGSEQFCSLAVLVLVFKIRSPKKFHSADGWSITPALVW